MAPRIEHSSHIPEAELRWQSAEGPTVPGFEGYYYQIDPDPQWVGPYYSRAEAQANLPKDL